MAQFEQRPAERVALAGVVVQLFTGVLALLFYKWCNAATVWVMSWQALIGVLVWLMSLTHLRNARLAAEEGVEWDRLQAERAAGGAREQLFEEDEIQAFAARNRLRIFEKYIAPIMGAVIAILLGLTVFLVVSFNTIAESQVVTEQALLSCTFMIAVTFVLFLISMYATGLARQAAWRPIRAGASYMMLSTLLGVAAVVSVALGHFEFVRPDRVAAYVMLGLMGIVAIEILLNFVLDFYRPRVEGVEMRAAYDSRLLGLLAEPGGILKTVAATLDYQFGFRVSQTWFYRFIEQAIAPLLLFQILTLYLLTCFVIVGPEQQGILECMGKFRRVCQPGLVLKWPWPIEKVYRFPANEVKTLTLGHAGKATHGGKMLWTVKHFETEYETMVARRQRGKEKEGAPVNLIVAAMTVRYRIDDVKKWYYNTADPERLLDALCSRTQGKFIAGVDFFELMGPGRLEASDVLQRMMQEMADGVAGPAGQGLGVRIVGVGLEEIHPPVKDDLPQAFHGTVTAVEQKEVDIFKARQAAAKERYSAETAAAETVFEAQGSYGQRVHEAEADVIRFRLVQDKYGADPVMLRVFKVREYLSALEEGIVEARKYLFAVSNLDTQHLRLELEDIPELGIEKIGKFEEPVMPEEKEED